MMNHLMNQRIQSSRRSTTGTEPASRSWLIVGQGVSLLILLGFGLRTIGLDAQSLWWDEGFSLDLARQSVPNIIRGDFHPPLYHLLLAGWTQMAGDSAFAARYFSVLCGTLVIPLAYRIGCQLFDQMTGRFAALLVAGSPVLLWYSQEARMYMLAALLYLVLIWLFHRLTDLRVPAPARLWLALAVVEIAGLYTHYFIALGIAWLCLAMLIRRWVACVTCRDVPDTPRHVSRMRSLLTCLQPFGVSQALVVLAYLPWLPIFFSLQGRYNPVDATSPTVPTFFNQVWHGFNAGSLALVGHHTAFMALSTATFVTFVIALIVAVVLDPRRHAMVWLLAHTVVPMGGVFVLMQIRPFFHPRYVVMLAPPLLIVIARLVSHLVPRAAHVAHRPTVGDASRLSHSMPFLGGVLLLTLGLTFATATYAFTSNPNFQRDDLRGLARHLSAITTPDDAIVFGYLDHPFRRYYDGDAPVIYLNLDQRDGEIAHTLADFLQTKKQAYLITWHQAPVDRRGLLGWLLASAGRLMMIQPWGDLTIHQYAVDRPVPAPAFDHRRADFGPLTMTGSQIPASAPAAGAVPVATAWSVPHAWSTSYKLALRLHDSVGHTLSQADVRLVGQTDGLQHGDMPTRITNYATLPLPLGTPPGVYSVDLVVYEAATLRRLDRHDVPGQRVALGTVRLTRPNGPFRGAVLPGFTAVEARVDNLALEGYALDRAEAGPGGTFSVALRWHVADTPDGAPVLRLATEDGVLAETRESLYPPTAWMPGQVVLDWRDLKVPADAPPGPATLEVLFNTARYTVANVSITRVDHRFDVPHMAHTLEVAFGDVAELLGYDLNPIARADEPVELTLYWRARSPSAIGYTVFTHLLDGDGRLVGQHDGVPTNGTRPTTGWIEGEIITDPHPMTWKDGSDVSVAQVEIGLYDPSTGQRLATAEGTDHVILPTPVEVRR